MRIVIVIDSFKGSLSSIQAGNAVKEAACMVDPSVETVICPLADGGEGTVDALVVGPNCQIINMKVSGPQKKPVDAKYVILDNGTAVIEMAQAAGLTLVPCDERNPMETTTYGVGELIRDAIKRGCRHFIVGIGGSATNDGGVGMLIALGYAFTDKNGKNIDLGAKGLQELASISDANVMPELKECVFRVACDVTNPLCGDNGCSAVFAKQKGATEEMIADMDRWLNNYAQIAKEVSASADANYPGAGAAGGLGFAFLSFLRASLESGTKIIIEETGIEKHIQGADLVITGEGRLDSQTVMGKAPIGIAKLAKKYGKKVIAFCGCATDDAVLCNAHGIDAYFPIIRGITTLDEALNVDNAHKNLVATAYQVFHLLLADKSN